MQNLTQKVEEKTARRIGRWDKIPDPIRENPLDAVHRSIRWSHWLCEVRLRRKIIREMHLDRSVRVSGCEGIAELLIKSGSMRRWKNL